MRNSHRCCDSGEEYAMHLSVAHVAYPDVTESLVPAPKRGSSRGELRDQSPGSRGTRTSNLGCQISVFVSRSCFEPGPGSTVTRGSSENMALKSPRPLELSFPPIDRNPFRNGLCLSVLTPSIDEAVVSTNVSPSCGEESSRMLG